jgi:hypothetical protein
MTITDDVLDEVSAQPGTPRERIRSLIAELEACYGVTAATPATLPLTQAHEALRRMEEAR